MSHSADSSTLLSTRWVELGLALFTALTGALVMLGSLEQGIGWGDAGPEPGYFPFYIGLLLSIASAANMLLTGLRWRALNLAFVSRTAFLQVLSVFIPIALFVAAMSFIGIYLASALFIAWFMWRDPLRARPYGKWMIGSVSLGAVLASYVIFALWFKVPLDAGPLGDWLALAGGSLK
ncbi:tripartite tricarboxylate transporter TctB family protein [Pseudomonas sp. LD120]|uniref:tripartite tricarboxylate transporter TctB family protein n=1 Tax=Pseudomonas sp. LD120 TaxID=485751 RepID=UPI001359CAD3|nr:tripartite tricarboxylate transporter TctB family protein [Pseudomonas sp. LD120]KAF0863477.1 tripartite tricarboxylate transporter TctB family protein [Pseudomonas sp. LD120]